MFVIAAILRSLFIILSVSSLGASLSLNYYEKTCPDAELIVAKAVRNAIMKDKTVAAALLRMHFHDCFIRSGGPTWEVPKGRKDGIVSRASETTQLPAPTFSISQLQQSFSQRGLSMNDLVALSGGHTLGFSHCSSFQSRIRNFNATHDIDPSMHPSFAESLKKVCPVKKQEKNAGATMDPSATTFDNTYFKLILQGKGLFSSDQALVSIPKTKDLVSKFASSQGAFSEAFVNSMIKMSSITGGQEVRKDCRVVN
ncbi:peroxidase 64-like [Tripterygium wilfordii]|uniref:peroxidase n=1 Tax=Tripterygium wilfordii TaxID=458696 RepID=A0A7J7CPI4_TRIWF|nr:peroxidase 64-like [Tripterygium wilfordii]